MKHFGATTIGIVLALLLACTPHPQEPSKAAVSSALNQFESEYGRAVYHSSPVLLGGGNFRVSVRGRFTVHGPYRATSTAPAIVYYRSGWIEFDGQGELLGVRLGSK